MENVQIGSVEQATLVVGVLAMATEDENGISGDSQVIRIEVSYNKTGVWVIGVVPGEFRRNTHRSDYRFQIQEHHLIIQNRVILVHLADTSRVVELYFSRIWRGRSRIGKHT